MEVGTPHGLRKHRKCERSTSLNEVGDGATRMSRPHEWLTDTLAATSTAGAIEGDDWSFNTATTRPVRRTNRTQIFRKDIAVSETQRAVNPAGFRDAYSRSRGSR
jgi:hypothetical protein